MFEAQEIYNKIQSEDYAVIDKMKNPFVLIQVSKMIHGGRRANGRLDERGHFELVAHAESEAKHHEQEHHRQQQAGAREAVRGAGVDGHVPQVQLQEQEAAVHQRRVHPEEGGQHQKDHEQRVRRLRAQHDHAHGQRRLTRKSSAATWTRWTGPRRTRPSSAHSTSASTSRTPSASWPSPRSSTCPS